MSDKIEKVKELNPFKKEVKKYAFGWGILISIGIIVMSIFFATGNVSLNFTLVLLLIALKFISGFGLILSILSFGMKQLEKNIKHYKGKDKIDDIKKYNRQLMIIPFLLLLYKGPYKLYASISEDGYDIDNIFDKIIFIYGVLNLIIRAYLIPLLHNTFLPPVDEEFSFKEKIEEKKKKIVKGVQKRYYKFTKNLGKMQYNEQETIKDVIEDWKRKFATYALLVIGIGMMVITPIAFIFIIFWVRVFILDNKQLYKFERYILMVGNLLTIVIALIIPFIEQLVPDYYGPMKRFSYLSDLSGFIGLLLGSWMYFNQLRNSEYMEWLERKQVQYEQRENRKGLIDTQAFSNKVKGWAKGLKKDEPEPEPETIKVKRKEKSKNKK